MGEVSEDPVLNIPETIAEVDDKEIYHEELTEEIKKEECNLVQENGEAIKNMASANAEQKNESLQNIPLPSQSFTEPLSPSDLLRSKLIENVSMKMLDSIEMSKSGGSPFLGRNIENEMNVTPLKKIAENTNESTKRKTGRSNTYMDTTEFSKNSSKINNVKIPETLQKRKNTVTGAPESRKMSTLSLSKVFTPALRKESISRFVSTLSISAGIPVETSFLSDTDSRKSSLKTQRKYSEVSVDLQPRIDREPSIVPLKQKPRYSKVKKTMILISSILMQIFVSEIFSLGPIYVKLMEVFNSSKSTTSLVQSLPQGIAYLCGIFVAPLISKFGLRLTLFVGSILSSAGFAAAAFVNNVFGIALLVGIVSGFGLCILNVVSYSAIAMYFDSSQSYAIAAVSAGLAIGSTLLPLYQINIIDIYGWNGNFLLMAGIILQACVMSFQFEQQPVKKTTENRSPKTENEVNFKEKLKEISKYKVLPSFFLSTFLAANASPIFSMMVVDFGIEKGYGMHRSTVFLIVYSFCTTVGRLLAGLASACRLSGMFTYLISGIISSVLIIALAFANNDNVIITFLTFIGLFMGCFTTVALVSLLEMVGSGNYQFCFGFYTTITGLGYLTCGPLAGFIADLAKSYSKSYMAAGLFMGASACLIIVTILITGEKHLLHRRIPYAMSDNEESKTSDSIL
ncbi:monocarboxylate transporter 2 [Octopus bimaculoides]|uniref:Major facilitator superfamily (MFS) profile domain-containing protein n=1 Tax=Octopus bimaculoides TaxID=37653 RepID=A0A0L8G0N0_OCTBM|nr:monocarboxylate transporter 2 [Octopus bimaculoides]|eukprot:XP_014785170.1 PREDICTED: monocarboxylate transporter 2-like [Octopus bimaculoides]